MASDGNALTLLQKEFPSLKSYNLPNYNIKYAKSGKYLKYKLLLAIPSILSSVKKEHKKIAEIIKKEENVIAVISDNRFGVYNAQIQSIYLTHQVTVLSGFLTYFTSKIHQFIIQKFDECWVPDVQNEFNLSGKLGHLKKSKFKLNYIGVLSRFKFETVEKKYDVLVVLSGPEPQRTLLENKLLLELKNYNGTILFVRGVLTETDEISAAKNIKIENYLLSKALNEAINESELIIARSGYSTIMDVAILRKKVFFIPTPGQTEQLYLAKRLHKKGIAPFSLQEDFTIEKLAEVAKFSGFTHDYLSKSDLNFLKFFKSK